MAPTSPDSVIEANAREHRLMLVFARSERDPSYEEQLRQIESDEQRLEKHRVRLGRILMEGTSRIAENILSEAEAHALRTRFQVAEDAFAAVLVDRDGRAVKRFDAPVPLPRLEDAFDSAE